MSEYFAVPVFHHGGKFVRDSGGYMSYVDGKVKRFPPMDLDYVNFFDLVVLFKELGYVEYKEMYWYDILASDMEAGLHPIKGDHEINEMRENKLKNRNSEEFYIYFDHPVDMPEVVGDGLAGENVGLSDSSSSSDDGYESAEDEAWKPPPAGYEEDSDTSSDERVLKKKTDKKSTPKKVVTQNKKKGNDKDISPSSAKRVASRKYSGVRRKHILKDGKSNGGSKDKSGPHAADAGPSKDQSSDPVDGGLHYGSNIDPNNLENDSDYERPYEYESEAFNSPISSDDEGRTAFDSYNEDTEYGEVEFKVGQMFPTMDVFKQALKDYFVYEGKDVIYIKNEKQRVRAACAGESCPWLILTSWNSANRCYQVKTLFNEHNCGRDFGSNLADRAWVTSKLVKRLLTQSDMKPKQAMEHMVEEYNVHVSTKMISRALKAAREVVLGNERAQYGKIRDYLMELHRSNPGSTALMEVIPQPESLPLFDRLYICMEACKKGFKEGCRPLIGLDGCFLKGYYGGQLLSTVGQDANNHFYVVAFAVVPNECKDTWKWFLTLLAEDLGAVGQHGWNFISDQQKGLELAMKEVMPNAHHRNCVLHIWKNFIKHFKDQQTKQLVWECARQTTIQEFKASMEKMKNINQGAWEYLQRFDPAVWAKAYFSHGPKVDNITNNMCEVWNAKIVEYRGRPILTMIDDLRCYVMRKMTLHKKKLENHTGKLAPVQHKRLEEFIKPKASKWRAIWAGDSDRVLFEVHRQGHKVGVNLAQRTCTCNVWQLTGMPCRHAVAAMYKIGVNPEDFVHTWLTMDSIRATYAHTMKPVNSEEYWEPTDAPRPLPPPIKRPAHRPKVKRRIDPVETEINPNKAKKTFEVTCNKCGQKGHYYKTCTNPAMDPNWKPMTKKERRANGAKKKSNSVGADVSKNTTNLQEGGHGNCNEATNVAGVGVNHKEKAKKDKKKLPKGEKKTTAVAPEGTPQEIPLSQNAPQSEEVQHATNPTNIQQGSSDVVFTTQSNPTLRLKNPVIRPPPPPTPNMSSFMPTPPPAPRPTLWFKSQLGQGPALTSHASANPTHGPITPSTTPTSGGGAISAETMAAASLGTASRIFKFVPTPGLRRSGLRPPKKM
ncbi:uncharacterized protein [Arachis hypogaea]